MKGIKAIIQPHVLPSVTEALCDEIVQAIQRAAHTGNPGDGVVMVANLDRVVRIRTGEEQDETV